MAFDIALTIGRNFENRARGESDDSPTAWEAHRKRGTVLRQTLDGSDDWTVTDWGDTFDTRRTHEDVVLQLSMIGTAVGLGVMAFAGKVLWRTLEDVAVDALKRLMVKLIPALEQKAITRAYATLPDGQSIEWSIDAENPDRINIWVHGSISVPREALAAEAGKQAQ
ncbi:hypothetical protein KUH32_05955 [Thalassococcus sp. CAU 1522]|uniref:Uncharacterized protein n=1 Tax=Thalassococcus arenae TaxID=2851652 RepID=A0ABS6N5L3_9RHOB|nr:hypothetical protein [Thalassococcus arenae]MBV2359307.1 hypothetical protein [Thalassococcus arenae]